MTNCHDISLAVIKQSESELRRGLLISPQDVNAKNKFGQTALHLSIDWPLGMRILLDAGADTECVDQANLVPLHYAIERLLVTIRWHLPWDAASEVPLDPIRILGEANCSFRDQRHVSNHEMVLEEMGKDSIIDHSIIDHQWHFLKSLGVEMECSRESNSQGNSLVLIFDTFLDLIAIRRKRLCDLARHTIPLSEIAHWLPHSTDESHVIDETASPLAFELERRGIPIPPHLHPGKDQITGYHYFAGHPNVLERLWKFGFRDVNGKDSLGRTPLMARTLNFPDAQSFDFIGLRPLSAQWIESVAWMLNKGADLYARQDVAFIESRCGTKLQQVRQLLNASSISLLAWKIGLAIASQHVSRLYRFDRKDIRTRLEPQLLLEWATENNTRQTLRRIVMDCTTDDCTCSCSVFGCTARTLITRSYAKRMWWCRQHKDLYERANEYRSTILGLAQVTGADAALWSSEALRLLTFQALGLRHTCCDWYCVDTTSDSFVAFGIKYQTEIDEIQKHNSAGLAKLEELLPEFQSKIDTLDITFSDFLADIWEPRMEQARDEMKASDMEASRDFGLKW